MGGQLKSALVNFPINPLCPRSVDQDHAKVALIVVHQMRHLEQTVPKLRSVERSAAVYVNDRRSAAVLLLNPELIVAQIIIF